MTDFPNNGTGTPDTQDQAPLLRVRNLTVTYGYVEALKAVNLDVFPREICAIVGDNGAGKSTLVRCLGGLIKARDAEFTWKGEPVQIPSVEAARNLGIASVFQSNEFCENLDVTANLFLGNELRSHRVFRNDQAMFIKARELLRTLSSPIRATAPIHTLSAGQKQTVAIARTLLNNPSLVLLDEPTAALSVIQTAETLSYIRSIRAQGRGIVFVSHNLPDVFAISDRVIVLRRGRISGVHNTNETSYEEIIAEITGAAKPADGSETGDRSALVGKLRIQRQLLDRSIL